VTILSQMSDICILVLVTLKMATWVGETCRWPQCNKIASIKPKLFCSSFGIYIYIYIFNAYNLCVEFIKLCKGNCPLRIGTEEIKRMLLGCLETSICTEFICRNVWTCLKKRPPTRKYIYLFYVWVSVNHKSILYKEPTRCNFGSIVY
jgi:hypothetical protein